MLPRQTPKADLIEEVDLGFLIARTIRTYHMPYEQVMSLPMRVFWQLSGYVDRIRADEARLTLQVATAAQSPEATAAMEKWFNDVAPGPFKLTGKALMERSSEADEDGIDQLRSLAAQFGPG